MVIRYLQRKVSFDIATFSFDIEWKIQLFLQKLKFITKLIRNYNCNTFAQNTWYTMYMMLIILFPSPLNTLIQLLSIRLTIFFNVNLLYPNSLFSVDNRNDYVIEECFSSYTGVNDIHFLGNWGFIGSCTHNFY